MYDYPQRSHDGYGCRSGLYDGKAAMAVTLLGVILVVLGAWLLASLALGLVLARHTHRGLRRRLGAARRLVMVKVPDSADENPALSTPQPPATTGRGTR
ncbi:hypothetical protein STTU_0183 [Streptomyces sp. Tu6071]|nr:predicted protein [Streptomyces sp. SPB78]EGJ72972.1 hypothetical protein STTU_0183 [Streptomyces sp. Tu6071]MYQ58651.1 hypothetical protein [Streptomyces sp. SID4926]MYR25586.1 hypothetical protein [Streptomyces sp. SID4945]MYX23967.1 hypothetical protein [Streptomyces sp. SID8380]